MDMDMHVNLNLEGRSRKEEGIGCESRWFSCRLLGRSC